jgi:hypothetical protein
MALTILLLCGLCGAVYGTLWYITAPFPAPRPYPGSKVEPGKPAIGAGRRSTRFDYTVEHSIR